MRVLDYTGIKTPTELFNKTSYYDRVFFAEAIPLYEREKAKKMKKMMGV